MKKTFFRGFLHKAGPIFGVLAMGLLIFAPAVSEADKPAATIDAVLVNSQAPTSHTCLSGTVTVSGSGTLNNQSHPEEFHIKIDWGDGGAIQDNIAITATALDAANDKNFTYTFSATHKYSAPSSSVIIGIYHAGQNGNDSVDSKTVNVCITTPPQPASLKVTTTVTNNHGGTLAPSAFLVTVTGTNVVLNNGTPASSVSFAGSSTGITVSFDAGAFSVTEQTNTGYAESASGCSGTATAGQSLTCSFTNSDIQPQLTVIKHVDNGDTGRLGTASDATLAVTGTNVTQASVTGSETGVTVGLDAGTYSVDEPTVPDDYTKTLGANCSGTIAVGQSLSCTVTNTANPVTPPTPPANPATLTIITNVTNDNGGALHPDNFTIHIQNTDPNATQPQDSPGSAAGTVYNLDPGTYSVIETSVHGYAFTSITGDGCSGTVTLAAGQSLTCTINNDDIAPQLQIQKTVVGGTATPDSFTFKIDGTVEPQGQFITLSLAGAHTVSEDPFTGYTASVWGGDCNADGTITLDIADAKTCTITNTADPVTPPQAGQATLTVIKHVVNGGDVTASNFSIHVQLTTDNQNVDVTGSPQPGSETGTTYNLDPGTYKIIEESAAGFTLALTGDCALDGSVTLAAGDAKTCTLTNTGQNTGGGPTVTTSSGGSGNGAADLEITTTFDPASTSTSSTVHMIVHVHNFGDLAALDVVSNVTIPTGLIMQSNTVDRGTFDPTTMTWNVGNMAMQDVGNLDITLSVPADITGSLNGNATVSSPTNDSNPNNNSSSAVLAVVAGASTTGEQPPITPPNPPDTGSTPQSGGNPITLVTINDLPAPTQPTIIAPAPTPAPQGQVLGASTSKLSDNTDQINSNSDQNQQQTKTAVVCKASNPLALGILLGYLILMILAYFLTRKSIIWWYASSLVLFAASILSWKSSACGSANLNWLIPAAVIIFLLFEFLIDPIRKIKGNKPA